MEILRDGKPETLSIKLGEFHAEQRGGRQLLGAWRAERQAWTRGQRPHADLRQQLSVPSNVQGVAVEQVRPASPAEDAGLQPGDVIVQVNRQPVKSAQNFVDKVHAAPAGKDLLLLVWSNGNSTYRVVHPANRTIRTACKPFKPNGRCDRSISRAAHRPFSCLSNSFGIDRYITYATASSAACMASIAWTAFVEPVNASMVLTAWRMVAG